MLYDLIGVVNHYGNQYFGHYTSKVLKQSDGWIEFDDERIRRCDEESVVSDEAYVLFYKKKNV